eukprot:TRINITY_DN20427_c1_g1_i1.p1 TRINITY_DN20427_c1_g1~~TRINITY_DN20427_c1_g1_i1.p1  ORF type:complete len:282 (-),score=56.46 TRINITY_DN20427_c1_g1_i1:222-1067(-)
MLPLPPPREYNRTPESTPPASPMGRDAEGFGGFPPPPHYVEANRSDVEIRAALGLSLRKDNANDDIMTLARTVENLIHRLDKFDDRFEKRLEFWQRKCERQMHEIAPKEVMGRLKQWVPEVDRQIWSFERQCQESLEAFGRLQERIDNENRRLEYFMNMYALDIQKVQHAIAEQDCRIEQIALTLADPSKGAQPGARDRVGLELCEPRGDLMLSAGGQHCSAPFLIQPRDLPGDEKMANVAVRMLVGQPRRDGPITRRRLPLPARVPFLNLNQFQNAFTFG